jgi:rfaE bifunctional protein nucleotidyltransferase chain/domain
MIKADLMGSYNSSKILSFNDAIGSIQKIKSKGKSVGLCHGGFDLLHPGHVKHFESAKKLCDFLFVSVTSNKFVSSRKGSGRPIFPDKLRAYMIASIEFVDYVIISDFKKAVDVIKLLKPSFYIKGPDFIKKTTPGIIAERESIKNVGGEIKYTNDPKLSTTEIIEYIKNKINTKNILICLDRDGTIIKNNDFFGRNKDWINEIEFNKDLISFISYLQTKYKTTTIVLTNQAGIARQFFDHKRLTDINNYIDLECSSKGIKINNWQYCPYVDSLYASKHPELNLDPKYIQTKTKRKPNVDMVLDGLKELNMDIKDFDEIIIVGDRNEDKELAHNLNAKFINVKNKRYEELLEQAKNI